MTETPMPTEPDRPADRIPTAELPPVPDRPLLQGERVWLRPIEERDLPAYVAAINDTEVGGLAGYAWPQSIEDAKRWLLSNREPHRGDGFFFAVCELGDDRFIGTTWLKDLNLFHGNAQLAIFMDRDHLGAGFGTDAQRALLAFAFRNLGLERVWLTVYVSNQRAIRSYEKLGFRTEGTMRRSWRGPRGLEDSLLMAILREDWEATQPPAG
jgi:RimJ/RimL family protein N-acetyltransferase